MNMLLLPLLTVFVPLASVLFASAAHLSSFKIKIREYPGLLSFRQQIPAYDNSGVVRIRQHHPRLEMRRLPIAVEIVQNRSVKIGSSKHQKTKRAISPVADLYTFLEREENKLKRLREGRCSSGSLCRSLAPRISENKLRLKYGIQKTEERKPTDPVYPVLLRPYLKKKYLTQDSG